MVLGTASNDAVVELTDAWLNRDGAGGLALIHEALASGTDPRQFCRQMVAYLRELLLLQAAGDALPLEATPEQRQEMLAQAQRAPRQGLIEAIKRFNEAALVAAGSWQPQLPLEMAFIELLPDKPMPMVTVTAVPTPTAAAEPPKTKKKKKEKPATEKKSEAPEMAKPKAQLPTEPANELVEVAAKPVTKKVEKTAVKALTVREVQAIWADLVTRSGDKVKNLPALLNMGKPLAAEGRTLVIGFDYPLFKDKFDNQAGAISLVADILTELLGQDTNVRGVVTSEYTVPVQPDDFRALAEELGGTVSED